MVSSTQVKKLAKLQPYQRGITSVFTVVKTEGVRQVRSRSDGSNHRVADVLVGDETGVMILTLWDDDISLVEEGKTFQLVGGQTTLFQGRLRLSLGRSGKLQASTTPIAEVKMERNLSDTPRSAPRDRKNPGKPTDKRGQPIRRTRGFKWARSKKTSG